MSLQVKPVFYGSGKKVPNPTENDPILKKLHVQIPHPTFRIILVGPSGSGKTSVAKWLLLEHYFNKKVVGKDGKIFDYVVVFCPTIDNDDTLRDLVQGKDPFFDPDLTFRDISKEFVEETVKSLNEQFAEEEKTATENGEPFRVLYIFDDASGELGKNPVIRDLFYKGRKINASVILMCNNYKDYIPGIRNNKTHLFVFKPGDVQQQTAIIDDLTFGRSKKELEETFKKVFYTSPIGESPKYRFIIAQSDQAGSQKFLREGFDKFI